MASNVFNRISSTFQKSFQHFNRKSTHIPLVQLTAADAYIYKEGKIREIKKSGASVMLGRSDRSTIKDICNVTSIFFTGKCLFKPKFKAIKDTSKLGYGTSLFHEHENKKLLELLDSQSDQPVNNLGANFLLFQAAKEESCTDDETLELVTEVKSKLGKDIKNTEKAIKGTKRWKKKKKKDVKILTQDEFLKFVFSTIDIFRLTTSLKKMNIGEIEKTKNYFEKQYAERQEKYKKNPPFEYVQSLVTGNYIGNLFYIKQSSAVNYNNSKHCGDSFVDSEYIQTQRDHCKTNVL